MADALLVQPVTRRLDFLDALRGLAALWVMLFHLRNTLRDQFSIAAPLWYAPNCYGSMGVDLFFVTSAFSLFYALSRRSDRSAWKFYLRRFFRIAPLFYLLMLASLMGPDFGASSDPRTRLINMFFIFNLVPGAQTSTVYAGWSVGVEMLFYLLFPLVYRYAVNLKRALLGTALCAALLWPIDWMLEFIQSTYPPHPIYPTFSLIFFARYLPTFLFGIVAFHAGFALSRRSDAFRLGIVSIVCSLLGLVAFFFYWRGDGLVELARIHHKGALIEQSAIFCLALIGLMNAPVKILVNRVTRFLGKLSYSIYLLHLPLLHLAQPLLRRIVDSTANPSLIYLASAALILALIVILPRFSGRPC